MPEDNHTNRHIYLVNDTKKEIFAVPINSTFEENDSEEIKSIDSEARLFILSFETSFNKFKENDWNYTTDDIKRVIDTEFNLTEYQTHGYVLK